MNRVLCTSLDIVARVKCQETFTSGTNKLRLLHPAVPGSSPRRHHQQQADNESRHEQQALTDILSQAQDRKSNPT